MIGQVFLVGFILVVAQLLQVVGKTPKGTKVARRRRMLRGVAFGCVRYDCLFFLWSLTSIRISANVLLEIKVEFFQLTVSFWLNLLWSSLCALLSIVPTNSKDGNLG